MIAKGATTGHKDAILVFMPDTPQTREVWSGLKDELSRNYRLVAVQVDTRADRSLIAEGIRRHRPASIVLMNNPTVLAYREHMRSSVVQSSPPVGNVMTS